MKKILMTLFVVLSLVSTVFAVDGDIVEKDGQGSEPILVDTWTYLTDSNPVKTFTVFTGGIDNIIVSVNSTHGCIVSFTPMYVDEHTGPEGKKGDTWIDDGGGKVRLAYNKIMSNYAKIEIEKTEAGIMQKPLEIVVTVGPR